MATENNTDEVGAEVRVVPNVDAVFIPKVGMEFDSLNEVYDFYNAYGKSAGFSVRKGKEKHDAGGGIVGKLYLCSKEGIKKKVSDIQSRLSSQTRCGCKALIKVRLNDGNGKYFIHDFNESHNHEMLPPSMSHRLRSQRRITPSIAAHVDIVERDGLTPKAGMELLNTRAGGIENVGLVREDYGNYLRTRNKIQMQKGDSGALASYFQDKLCSDRAFFHAIDMDEDDMITNIFWADGQMVTDYLYFGDVVSFDTTFKTNTKNRPLALFVGLNHHKQTVIFGAALQYEESCDAFSWLFKTFVKCMHGKEPQTIITDQDQTMAKAICAVLPRTVHRNCIWHFYQNAVKHLSNQFRTLKGFKEAFRDCIYTYETDSEFEEAWQNMIDSYGLSDNEWLDRKYKEREKWSLAYGRHHFCADMLSTQVSESMNASIKNALNRQKSMMRFLTQIDVVVAKHRYIELASDKNMMLRRKEPRLIQPMFIQASKLYTPTVYNKLEKEATDIWSYKLQASSKTGDVEIFKVVNRIQRIKQVHTVTYNGGNGDVQCSCKKFEFAGILCRHIFFIFHHKDIEKIPEKYILKRWRRDAKEGLQGITSLHASSANSEISKISNRYSCVCSTLVQLASKSAVCQKATDYVMQVAEKTMNEVEKIVKETVFQELPKDVETVNDNEHNTETFENEETVFDGGRPLIDEYTDDAANIDVVEEVGSCENEQMFDSQEISGVQLFDAINTSEDVSMSQKRLENAKGVNVKERSKRAGMSVRRKVDALTQAIRKKRPKKNNESSGDKDTVPSSQSRSLAIPPSARMFSSPNEPCATFPDPNRQMVPQNIEGGGDKNIMPPTQFLMPVIHPQTEAYHMFPYHNSPLVPIHHLHSFLLGTNQHRGSPSLVQMLQEAGVSNHYSPSSARPSSQSLKDSSLGRPHH